MACLNSIYNQSQINACPFRIVLATTNYGEFRFFNRLLGFLPFSDLIDVMCVEDYIADTLGFHKFADRYRRNEDRVIVNAKKFMAMHWAMRNGYEWIASVDSDMCAVGDISQLFKVLTGNYESGQYFGHSGHDDSRFVEINANCRGLFSKADQDVLRQLTKNDLTYAWFFDIPFYKGSDLETFFSDMASDHDDLQAWLCRLDYFSFEHLVFLFWRCLRQQAVLIDYHEIGLFNIPEYLSFQELLRIKGRYGYVPAWVQFREMMTEPDMARAFPDVSLLFHYDRM